MEVYKLSTSAQIDLTNIYAYGIVTFGLLQAQNYFKEIQKLLKLLSKNKDLGRDASEFIPQLRRFSFKAHTIFYLFTDYGILVIRVLSHSMDYETHFNH